MIKRIFVVSALINTAILAGCTQKELDRYKVNEYEPTTSQASMYCVQQGGALDMISENNMRVMYCVTSNGDKIEVWEYYENRGKNKEKQ